MQNLYMQSVASQYKVPLVDGAIMGKYGSSLSVVGEKIVVRFTDPK
jgi:hypothetical protein